MHDVVLLYSIQINLEVYVNPVPIHKARLKAACCVVRRHHVNWESLKWTCHALKQVSRRLKR